MTDPEDLMDVMPGELAETEPDQSEEFDRPLPLEAEPADAVEQQLEVPDAGEDDYPQ